MSYTDRYVEQLEAILAHVGQARGKVTFPAALQKIPCKAAV
jgi:hypothetical protein